MEISYRRRGKLDTTNGNATDEVTARAALAAVYRQYDTETLRELDDHERAREAIIKRAETR